MPGLEFNRALPRGKVNIGKMPHLLKKEKKKKLITITRKEMETRRENA
jgi:hypothetical protein